MLASDLVFEKAGNIAEKFFETEHTGFYRFKTGEILTVTKYEYRASPLGIAGVSFLPRWILIEKDHIVFENTYIFRKDLDVFNPAVEKIVKFKRGTYEHYEDILREKANGIFEKILTFLEKKEYQKIAGLGPGLTPLGDDILSGMYAAGFEEEIKFNTNEISRQQLIHAKKGFVPYPVKVFLETGDDSLILQMGATSGAGWAFGITYYLEG